ncbi:Serine carboxypeptidase-like 46 [Hibiscus syriacus]|uniref:Carboxypeptidase n=1 Tax=Hibiscus syriacus TaxID=106335 RepID=A0A6A3A9T8_HIBSY|nr:Serine carboxypeptidase-like 46 [Hibiscus syriacus]
MISCSEAVMGKTCGVQPSNLRFQKFSGYVTVDYKKHKALFYYFVEAETDPASKPLVLWLNGEANMLYLETPIGVGFFYATNSSSYVTVDDEITARDNLVFLKNWYKKFPNYRHRDLYITGESYAGHYIPQLAKLMVEFNMKQNLFNFKGIALDNPVMEFATDFNSRAEYFWSHGLISDSTYKMFTLVCNYSRYVSKYYRDSVSSSCSEVMSQVSRETSKFVDKYDEPLDVCISSVLSQSMAINPLQVSERIDVCVKEKIVNYLNRKDVRKALHARLVGVRRWIVCSNILDYQLLNLEIPTISIVGSLIKAGIPELGLETIVPYRVWFEGKQVGGWTQVYDNILSFATNNRGASHEAPFSQPERSIMLFKSFLEGKPLPEVF